MLRFQQSTPLWAASVAFYRRFLTFAHYPERLASN
jgi:hypothetical protein